MSITTLRAILQDETMTDAQLSVFLERAKKLAKNQYFWHKDDRPTESELERFYDKYEYEIYDIVNAMYADASRDGEIRHEELGIVRVWESGGSKQVNAAVAAIMPKTYIV